MSMDLPVDPLVASTSEEGTSMECYGTEKELPCNPTSSTSTPGMEPECSNTEQTENTLGRSRRRRSEPVKFQGAITSCSSEWTRKEREALLIALKKYGHLDVENLCKAVPAKTPERIRHYINAVWKHSRLSLMKSVEKKHQEKKGKKLAPSDKSYLAPLDQWLEKMKDAMPSNFNESRAVSLAKAVQFIAKYEDHPDPSKCDGVDFRAVYEFLFCMLSGFPPKTLDPTTSQFLLIIMRNFARTMKKTKFDLETQLLQQPLAPSFSSGDPDIVCERCTDDTTAHASMMELLKIPSFNPFNIPVEMLKKLLLSDISQVVIHTRPYSSSTVCQKAQFQTFVPEVCDAIYAAVEQYITVPQSEEDWKQIIRNFEMRWNFPCFGAIDGKHVVIKCPPKTVSEFYNYKGTFSIVLFAVANSNYCFTYIDIGNAGRSSDGGIFFNSRLRNVIV